MIETERMVTEREAKSVIEYIIEIFHIQNPVIILALVMIPVIWGIVILFLPDYLSRKQEEKDRRKTQDMERINVQTQHFQEVAMEVNELRQGRMANLTIEARRSVHEEEVRRLFLSFLYNANYLIAQYTRKFQSSAFRVDNSENHPEQYAKIEDSYFDITYFYTTYETYLDLFAAEFNALKNVWGNLENSVKARMDEQNQSDQTVRKSMLFFMGSARESEIMLYDVRRKEVEALKAPLLALINKVDASIYNPESLTEGE